MERRREEGEREGREDKGDKGEIMVGWRKLKEKEE